MATINDLSVTASPVVFPTVHTRTREPRELKSLGQGHTLSCGSAGTDSAVGLTPKPRICPSGGQLGHTPAACL